MDTTRMLMLRRRVTEAMASIPQGAQVLEAFRMMEAELDRQVDELARSRGDLEALLTRLDGTLGAVAARLGDGRGAVVGAGEVEQALDDARRALAAGAEGLRALGMHAGPARAQGNATADAPATVSSSAMRVLLVEDEAIVRKSLVRQLKHFGLDVLAVGSGAEALVAVEVQVPDLVLSDLTMPGMDGLALARRLRERYPALRMVIMSGNVPEELQPELAALDLARLDKPFGEQELRAVLGPATR